MRLVLVGSIGPVSRDIDSDTPGPGCRRRGLREHGPSHHSRRQYSERRDDQHSGIAHNVVLSKRHHADSRASYFVASAPACATFSSMLGAAPPAPIPPTTFPSLIIGIPPRAGVISN